MNRDRLSISFYSLALIIGVIYAIRTAQKWWFYLLLIFLIAPAFLYLGWALGKEEEEPPTTETT